MNRWVVVSALFVTAACTTEREESFTCAIGELTGTWRIRYEETNGSCGEVADETVILGAGETGTGTCTVNVSQISADKCRLDLDYVCPTSDNAGSQHWVGTYAQTGADLLEGSNTVQAEHPAFGICRSTYNVTWTRQ